MTITIRELDSEAEAFDMLNMMRFYSFRTSPSLPAFSDEKRQQMIVGAQGTRHYALFEDDEPVASAATLPLTQNVRGKLYQTTGLWAVCTLPQGRRKGYVRQLLADMFTREREFVFGGLYPFRESFYQRMGYVTFPKLKSVSFDVALLSSLLKHDFSGKVELLNSRDGFDEWRNELHCYMQQTHGMAVCYINWTYADLRDQDQHWLAYAVIDGQRRGMMLYKIIDQDGKRVFNIHSLFTQDADARYHLLEWVARHIDQVARVSIALPPDAQPELWMPDMIMDCRFDKPGMARVLDVARLEGMQVGDGGFSARISDPVCPWNNGIYRFEARDGLLHVEPVASADFDLTMQGLSALVFGTHPAESFAFKGWGNPTPAAQALFPRMQPFMFTRY